ncbi:hypothetical protein Pmani_030893 [Petrolisthes manimaculis]|uniref:Uncharacterized protein n=1 Tax=Petrolisthes manimaculis TaxID=1843537 RepID=A0AAE1NWP5_9EUCA|nr:hypothetical protein Pmani_030893 [Petrolisthes manimaculis]
MAGTGETGTGGTEAGGTEAGGTEAGGTEASGTEAGGTEAEVSESSRGKRSVEEGILCRLAWRGPDRLEPIPSLGSVYFFWPGGLFSEGLQNGTYVLGSDGLLYLQFNNNTDDYPSSLDLCKKLPGHRIASAHTYVQLHAITKIAREKDIMPWLGLTMDEQLSIMMWVNAGPFNTTEVAATTPVKYFVAQTTTSTAFIFNNGTLEELPRTDVASTLCQANPLGIDW